MKELHDCVSVWYEKGMMFVKIHKPDDVPNIIDKGGFFGIDVYVNVILEKFDNELKITGNRILWDGGYSRNKLYVKNLKERPSEKWINRDIFGREYVRWVYEYPAMEDKREKSVSTNSYTIIFNE